MALTARRGARRDRLGTLAAFLLVEPQAPEPLPPKIPRGVGESEFLASRPAAQRAAADIIRQDKRSPITQATIRDHETERQRRRESAERLQKQGEVLDKRLWTHRREIARAQSILPPSLPKDFLDEVHDWNKSVLALADAHLSVRDAGKVAVFPALLATITGGFGGPDPEKIGELIADNLSVVARIGAMQ
jgi:hypothetical protein